MRRPAVSNQKVFSWWQKDFSLYRWNDHANGKEVWTVHKCDTISCCSDKH